MDCVRGSWRAGRGGHVVYRTSAFVIASLVVFIALSSYLTSIKVRLVGSTRLVTRTGDGARLEHWRPDWYDHADIGLMLYNRVRRVKQRCIDYDGERNQWKILPRVKIARSNNLEYCHTAKAGSTFWSNLLQVAKDKEMIISGDPRAMIVSFILSHYN